MTRRDCLTCPSAKKMRSLLRTTGATGATGAIGATGATGATDQTKVTSTGSGERNGQSLRASDAQRFSPGTATIMILWKTLRH
jgi:hypothetical protein